MSARIQTLPADITLGNPDVLSLYAQLLAGERFGKRFGNCPVCGRQHFTTRTTCSRAYCAQVWKIAKGLYRLAPSFEEPKPTVIAPKPAKKKPTKAKPVPVVTAASPSGPLSEAERWMAEHALLDCARMNARLAASSCGMNWRCFKPSRCVNVPDGATCPPIPDGWGL